MLGLAVIFIFTCECWTKCLINICAREAKRTVIKSDPKESSIPNHPWPIPTLFFLFSNEVNTQSDYKRVLMQWLLERWRAFARMAGGQMFELPPAKHLFAYGTILLYDYLCRTHYILDIHSILRIFMFQSIWTHSRHITEMPSANTSYKQQINWPRHFVIFVQFPKKQQSNATCIIHKTNELDKWIGSRYTAN